MGLAAVGHHEATLRLTRLLADTEMVARQAAARALVCSGTPKKQCPFFLGQFANLAEAEGFDEQPTSARSANCHRF